ncbi:MAG TPA: dienelactone hydrolase family protein [Methylomirabilota bacterium]|jgi:dienelactone hydrolase
MASARRFGAGCVAAVLLAVAAGCATSASTVRIRERSVRVPVRDVHLTAVLFTPETPPAEGARRPAIVLMHGCGGLYTSRGELTARHRDWSERFASWGFVTLILDSFTARGFGSICDLKERPAHPWNVRTGDAYAALDYLVNRPDVDPAHVFVLGWSHGGSTVTGVVRPEALGRQPGGPRFRAAIAFYPGCARPLRERGYRSTMPLLILQGGADDLAPAAPCVELGERLKNNRFPVTVVIYPGAHHDFDYPGLRFHYLPNIYNPAAPGERGGHAGVDEPSRLKAIDETRRFVDANLAR